MKMMKNYNKNYIIKIPKIQFNETVLSNNKILTQKFPKIPFTKIIIIITTIFQIKNLIQVDKLIIEELIILTIYI